jgi:hypothetical protein
MECVGLGLTDNNTFDQYTRNLSSMNGLQWIDWDSKSNYLFNLLSHKREPTRQIKLNSFKLAAQYSFYVSEKQDEYGFWIFTN